MGSKKRHKHREDDYGNEEMGQNNPFGIDMNQLMGMLGGVDQNTLNNVMNNLNGNGVNMENLNLNNMMNQRPNNFKNQNNFNNMNMGNNMDPIAMINNLMNKNNNNNNANNGFKQNSSAFKQNNNSIKHNYENGSIDPNIEMLLSVRKIVDSERKLFIDKILDLYKDGVFED